MTCEECAPWLAEYAENETPEDTRRLVREHLATCEGCRAELRENLRLSQAARALPPLEPGVEVVLKISEAILSAPPPRRRTDFGPVLDTDELAEFLHLTPETLELYLDEIPCFELGGKLLFRRKGVEEWLERRESDFAVEAVMSTARRGAALLSVKPEGGASWKN